VAVLPALALQLLTGFEHRRHIVAEATAEVARASAAMAEVQAHVTESTRLLLTALAAMPELRAKDPAACSALFASLLDKNPIYTNILAVDANGDMFASGLPFGHINLADRKHFREAMATGRFAAGEYIISRTSGKPSFPFAQPFNDADGQPAGILVASVRLDAFEGAFDKLRMPPGAVFGLSDHNGIRLFYRPPNPSNPVGSPIRPEVWEAVQAGGDDGVVLLPGSDGVRRYYAYQKLHLAPAAPPYMTVIVGLPDATVLAPARQSLLENLFLLGLATALALAVAFFIGGPVIAGRLNRIADTAARIGQGDRLARTGLPHSTSGIGKVAASLDAMAGQLAASDAQRDRALCALRDSQQRLAHITASMPDWIWETDEVGCYVYVGDKIKDSLGYEAGELVGKTVFDLYPPGEEAAMRPVITATLEARQPIRDFINWRVAADGSRRCLMCNAVPWYDEDGTFRGYRGVSKDMTQWVEADRAVRASLAEKEILLKEIHHRVKNNLQIISSLLYLQSEQVSDPVALESFQVSRNRIASMALVHEEIYRSADLSRIRLDTYIQDLLPKIFGQSCQTAPFDIDCRLAPVTVPIEQAVPAGLVVNELLTNAHKHAFRHSPQARLRVTLTEKDSTVEVAIADNGPGLPPDFDLENTGTLGMQLVCNLTRQLGGTVSAHNDGGAVFTLRFPTAGRT
jgi:PAS domain S-box-containing protein